MIDFTVLNEEINNSRGIYSISFLPSGKIESVHYLASFSTLIMLNLLLELFQSLSDYSC